MSDSGIAIEQPEEHKTKRLPEPPALVILVLTLLLGIMVIPAIVSVFLYLGAEILLSSNSFDVR